MKSRLLCPIAFLAAFAVIGSLAHAQAPRAHVPTVDGAPQLDGELESLWQEAVLLGEFREVEPHEGELADPATEVRLMRNATHLFVAMTCFEPEPEKMVLQNMERDAFLEDDDRIEFVFDTFHDGKTAYFFQMSAAGSRGDGLIAENGSRFNKKWNGVWQGRVERFEDRWVAEMAIPFRSLSFGDDGMWRANFQRYRGASRSSYRWAFPVREYWLFTVLKAGELTGFDGIESGWGVEFRPYLKVNQSHLREGSIDDTRVDLGAELSFSITPELKASVTWNTDFAETEVDDRRVNLSRYSTFFPEKRDFFLQDSNLFEFGPRGHALKPFFSRRIGLVDSEEVPIESGLRVAGRIGEFDLGVLAVRTDAVDSLGVPGGELGVFRPAWNIKEGVSLGALFTYGNPESDAHNHTFGFDFRGSAPDVADGLLGWNMYAIQSSDDMTNARGWAGGGDVFWKDESLEVFAKVISTSNDYTPGLGYVRRPGETLYRTKVKHTYRFNHDWLRELESSISAHWWVDSVGEVSQAINFDLFALEFHDGSVIDLSLDTDQDRVDESFEPADGTTIEAGFYEWLTWGAEYESSSAGEFAYGFGVHWGDWYSGQMVEYEGGLMWRPSAAVLVALDYSLNHGVFDDGGFDEQIAALSFDWNFSQDSIFQNMIQWDTDSKEVGVQSRVRWFVEDGRELFLVLNTGWVRDENFRPIDSDLTAKLVYAVRF